MEKVRCPWCQSSPLMIRYHDTEWGVPLHDDRKHFEFIVLDTFQAGLSWSTIINKRENFRRAFDDFDPEKIARYGEEKFLALMNDAGIIRNRAKIRGTVKNAQAFLKVQEEYGSFDAFIWQFTGGVTKQNRWQEGDPIPASSAESDAMSAALKKLGFTFVGTTICYAYMQAAGMINDHWADCFRYEELLAENSPGVRA